MTRRRPWWRDAVEIAAVAAVALLLAFVLAQSGVYRRVRNFPDAIPGVEWKDIIAFALPFLALVWVFIVRRGETASLVGLFTVLVLFAGHPWSRLDWTEFAWRGIGLAHGAPPSPAIALAFVAVFVGAAAWQLVRRRARLREAYAEKQAEPRDAEIAWAGARAGALGVVATALVASLGALAGVLVVARVAAALPPLVSVAVGLSALVVAALGFVLGPRAWEKLSFRRA